MDDTCAFATWSSHGRQEGSRWYGVVPLGGGYRRSAKAALSPGDLGKGFADWLWDNGNITWQLTAGIGRVAGGVVAEFSPSSGVNVFLGTGPGVGVGTGVTLNVEDGANPRLATTHVQGGVGHAGMGIEFGGAFSGEGLEYGAGIGIVGGSGVSWLTGATFNLTPNWTPIPSPF